MFFTVYCLDRGKFKKNTGHSFLSSIQMLKCCKQCHHKSSCRENQNIGMLSHQMSSCTLSSILCDNEILGSNITTRAADSLFHYPWTPKYWQATNLTTQSSCINSFILYEYWNTYRTANLTTRQLICSSISCEQRMAEFSLPFTVNSEILGSLSHHKSSWFSLPLAVNKERLNSLFYSPKKLKYLKAISPHEAAEFLFRSPRIWYWNIKRYLTT